MSSPTQTDIRFIAAQYIAAGWSVVPLPKGEKRADESWRKKTYTPKHFSDGDNIAGKCGEPSAWRVDVDLDSPEAVAVGALLLPRTGLVHGRPGKPDSHYWYRCEGAKTRVWKDVKDTSGKTGTLLELRSTGGYTVLPPSVWTAKDGSYTETLAWSVERDLLVIEPEELDSCCNYAGIATLLAVHWPGPGARHHAAGHLAGFLCRYGVPDIWLIKIIEAAARAANDPDVKDRVVFARGTLDKHLAQKDIPLTGGPKLAESFGDDVVTRLKQWLGARDDDALEEMNRKHFWVRLGKDDVIGREDDPSGVIFQRPRSLYSEYANRKIQVGVTKKGEPTFKPVFEAWLEWGGRRNYRSVVFAPPPKLAHPEDYNLWTGYAVKPEPGDCSLFLEHVYENICSGNREHYNYLMNLLALTAQEPGTPSGVAVVMRGQTGTGKGIFARAIGDLFGRRHYAHLDKVEQLAGKFNAALSGKIVVFADEAFFAGDRREHGALKRLITEPTLHIERKGIDGVNEDNHVHLFMATNERWSWPAMMHERRGYLLEVSDQHMRDTRYFGAIADQLKNKGLEALLAHLLSLPIDRGLIYKVPLTEELRQQQELSLSHEMTWWQEILQEGAWGQGLGWPTEIDCSKPFELYLAWCQARRVTRVLSKIAFGMRVSDYLSAEKSFMKRKGKDIQRCYRVRSLPDAREFFDKRLGTASDWPSVAPQNSPF